MRTTYRAASSPTNASSVRARARDGEGDGEDARERSSRRHERRRDADADARADECGVDVGTNWDRCARRESCRLNLWIFGEVRAKFRTLL